MGCVPWCRRWVFCCRTRTRSTSSSSVLEVDPVCCSWSVAKACVCLLCLVKQMFVVCSGIERLSVGKAGVVCWFLCLRLDNNKAGGRRGGGPWKKNRAASSRGGRCPTQGIIFDPTHTNAQQPLHQPSLTLLPPFHPLHTYVQPRWHVFQASMKQLCIAFSLRLVLLLIAHYQTRRHGNPNTLHSCPPFCLTPAHAQPQEN